MARKLLFLSVLAAALACVSGCQDPCDAYCEANGDYIAYCLENGSQGAWVTADWSYWGSFTNAEEFVADCQADLAAQQALGGEDEVIAAICTDQANVYTQMTDRELCADLQ